MRMKRAVVCFLGALSLAALVGPANAQPVTYYVDLVYEKIVDGPRPQKIVRVPITVASAQIAETLCRHSQIKLSRRVLEQNGHTLGLTGNWLAGGGECVRGEDGKVELTVQASSGGSN